MPSTPITCCVKGCKSKEPKGNAKSTIQFYPLPLNKPPILTRWLIVLDRRDWMPDANTRICSLHFIPDDFISGTKPNQGGKLKPDATPSVFPDVGNDGDEEDQNDDPEAGEENKEPEVKIKEEVEEEETPPKARQVAVVEMTPSTPSSRPRRAPKISSKMKDYILFDDIKKGSPSTPGIKIKKEEDDSAAHELLSILEDSNSASGDEAESRPKQHPGSVKRGRPSADSGKSPLKSLESRKYKIQVDDKTLLLNYSDLNPSVNMGVKASLTTDKVKPKVIDILDSGDEGPSRFVKDRLKSLPHITAKTMGKTPNKTQVTKVESSTISVQQLSKKKKYKTVAEIVLRTDEKGVSIENVTPLETPDSPVAKKPKLSVENLSSSETTTTSTVKQPTPSGSNFLQVPEKDEDLAKFSRIIASNIRKVKQQEKANNKAGNLTVIISSFTPPLQENDMLVVKRINKVANAERLHSFKVDTSTFNPSESQDKGNEGEGGELPAHIVSVSDAKASTSDSKKADEKEGNSAEQGDTSMENPDLDPTLLGHDHTYITQGSLGLTELESTTEEVLREVTGKPKLSDEEIEYRSKAHKKIRLLKEAVKRKNEVICKLKERLFLYQKSLRDEKKISNKGKKSKNGMFEMKTEELDENNEDSEDDDGDADSPITYICEPAIDVDAKVLPE